MTIENCNSTFSEIASDKQFGPGERQVVIPLGDYLDLMDEFYVAKHLSSGVVRLAVTELNRDSRSEVDILGMVAAERLEGVYARLKVFHKPIIMEGGAA